MDLVVDDNGGINVNFVVGALRAKPCVNPSLSKAFESPSKAKSLTSSNESIYEFVDESNNEDSENEKYSDSECDPNKNINGQLNVLDAVHSVNQAEMGDPSDSAEMDEVFVVVDDDANDASEENIDASHESSDTKRDCNSINDAVKHTTIEKKEGSVLRLSDAEDEIESALDEFVVTDSKEEEKEGTNVLLSSDDDGMDGLLEEFREENSLGENSSSLKENPVLSNTVSAKQNEKLQSISKDFSAGVSPASKSLPINEKLNATKNTNISSFHNSLNTVSIKREIDCEILSVNDEKSNGSNSSSIQILDEDNSAKATSQNISSDKISEIPFNKLNSPLKSPSFSSSSSEDKFEFDNNMILDIVDQATPENRDKTDISSLESKPSEFSDNDSFRSQVKSFNSNIELLESKSNVNNTCSTENMDIKYLTDKHLQKLDDNSSKDDTLLNISNTNILTTVENLNDKKPTGANSEILNVNNGVLPDTDLLSHSIKSKNVHSDAEEHPVSNVASTVEVPKDCDEDNDELMICDDLQNSSETLLCNEDKPLVNKQVNHDDTPRKQVAERDHDRESLEAKTDAFPEVSSSVVSESGSKIEIENVSQLSSTDVVGKDSECNNRKIENSMGDDVQKSNFQLETKPSTVKSDDMVESGVSSLVCKSDSPLKAEPSNVSPENKIENDVSSLICKSDSLLRTEQSNIKSKNIIENVAFNLVESKCLNNELQLSIDATNKRKLEDTGSETKVKKLKSDNADKENETLLNGNENSSYSNHSDELDDADMKDLKSNVNLVEIKAADKLNRLMSSNDPTEKIRVSLSTLDTISMYLINESVKEAFKDECTKAENMVKILESKLKAVTNDLEKSRLVFSEWKDIQRVNFPEHNFRARMPTRTVGVNVKIYRTSQTMRTVNNVIVPKTEPSSQTPNSKALQAATSIVASLASKDTIITPVLSTPPGGVKKPLLPRIIAQSNRPVVGAQVMPVPSKIAPPNVTVSGNRFISVGRPPSTHSVVLVPSSSITSNPNNKFIDLTKEEHKLQRIAPSGAPAGTTAVAKVNMPAMPNNPNVLVPLRDYLQLLPPGSKGSAVIQQSNVARPSLIPPLPSSLLGARTVTYIVPQNSGFGTRTVQPIVQPQNQQGLPQQLQFVLRVTNPGTAPTLSSVVNTVARPTMLQPPLATAPRLQPPLATTPRPQTPQVSVPQRTSSGLILFSHTAKHPAPFPKSPHYPDNKGKGIPPKPSLKGSKNSNGIVLSWNMCLFRHHANIASYQLFAYQETDGPVDASLWKKVGDVNALPLPMACTLTQFVDKNRYYFTVRAVDVYQRFGPFSDPVSILYEKESEATKK